MEPPLPLWYSKTDSYMQILDIPLLLHQYESNHSMIFPIQNFLPTFFPHNCLAISPNIVPSLTYKINVGK